MAINNQIIGGNFTDPSGVPLANGVLVFQLCQDEQSATPGQITAGRKIQVNLDSTGNVPASPAVYMFANDSLNPANSYYTVWAYSSVGQPVWGPQQQQVLSSPSPFNLSNWVPNAISSASIPAPTPLLETNGTPNGSQTKFNAVAGSGMTITDDGSGDITFASSGGGTSFPDPTACFFGRTNIDLLGNGIQSGDPQIVWDSANNQWVMFYYVVPASTPPFVQTWKAVATSLEGPWTGNTRLTTLDAYHKVRLLTDVNGNLVTVGGTYYAVGVFYDGTISHKQVFLFSNATLNGDTWAIQNSGNPVVAKSGSGGAGVYDDFCTDSPAFVFNGTTFYLWYTGFPSVSQADFGLAPRIMLATAITVTGAYAKQAGYVLGSSTVGGAWDFGYAEGPQVMKNANGTYFMAYVGGNTRPVSAGTEPNTNLWGMATAPAITGPWTRVPGPFAQLTGLPQWPTGVPNSGSIGTIVDTTNVWRPYLVLDPITNKWYVFYNTGNGASPVERVTFARQGLLSFSNGAYVGGISSPPGPNGGYILILTSGEQQIPGSQVFLRPGRYRVRYQVVQQDVGGTTPHLTAAFFIRPNGTKAGQWSQSFFANYAFEGDDYEVEDEIVVKAPAGIADNSQYTDASLQITSGTPTANTVARNLRVLIEQL